MIAQMITEGKPITADSVDAETRARALRALKAEQSKRQRVASTLEHVRSLASAMSSAKRAKLLTHWRMVIKAIEPTEAKTLCIAMQIDASGDAHEIDRRLITWATTAPYDTIESWAAIAMCIGDVMHRGTDVAQDYVALCRMYGLHNPTQST